MYLFFCYLIVYMMSVVITKTMFVEEVSIFRYASFATIVKKCEVRYNTYQN